MEKSRKVTCGEAFDKEKSNEVEVFLTRLMLVVVSSRARADGEGSHNCNSGLLAPDSASFVDAALEWRKLIPTAIVGSLAVCAAANDVCCEVWKSMAKR